MLFGGVFSTLEDVSAVGGGDGVLTPYARRSGAESSDNSIWLFASF